MTNFTFGSAPTDTSLIAPVVRSATSTALLSTAMTRPLVLSRQPRITPGAGRVLGNGVGGSGGGGRRRTGLGLEFRGVVNGCDAASLNFAQPLDIGTTVLSTASAQRADRLIRMTDRLRELAVMAATRPDDHGKSPYERPKGQADYREGTRMLH